MSTLSLAVSINFSSDLYAANPHDFIEIKFEIETVDFLQGLHCYMNTLLNTNDEVIRYQLRKVSHYWGFRESNFIYYMFATPWVRTYVVSLTSTDTFQNDSSSLHLIKGRSMRSQETVV